MESITTNPALRRRRWPQWAVPASAAAHRSVYTDIA